MSVTFSLLGGPRLLADALASRLELAFPGCSFAEECEPGSRACVVVLDGASGAVPGTGVAGLDRGALAPEGVPLVAVHWARIGPGAERHGLTCPADACLSGSSSLDSLPQAVRAALEGSRWIAPEFDISGSTRVALSPQERRALALYASGLTLDMVAVRMEITPNTAKHYLNRVRDKYGDAGVPARTKVELHQLARAEGYLP